MKFDRIIVSIISIQLSENDIYSITKCIIHEVLTITSKKFCWKMQNSFLYPFNRKKDEKTSITEKDCLFCFRTEEIFSNLLLRY